MKIVLAEELNNETSIVIGTPGRIIDLIKRRIISTRLIRLIVIDEADEMLSFSFQEQIKTIMKKMLINVLFGTALFSYTASAQSKIDTPATYKEAWQKQKKAAAKQESLAKEQSEKAKEQQKMMDAVKQEMLKDGLIQKNENYELTST